MRYLKMLEQFLEKNTNKEKVSIVQETKEDAEPIKEAAKQQTTLEEPECISLARDLAEPSKSESGTNISESTVSGVSYDTAFFS